MAKPTKVIGLVMEKHGRHVIERLQSIFDDSAMCDVTLTAGDLSIQAHKVVLAANSDYFQAMFSGNWSEKHESNIVLEDLTPRGLRAVVEFSYHGKLTVDCENIMDIVSAIHHCQLVKAYKLCEEYLCDEIDKANFLDLLNLSNTFSLNNLRKKLVEFVVDELMPSPCRSADMAESACRLVNKLDASFLKQVLEKWKYFESGIGRCGAVDVVRKWAKYDFGKRKKYLSELLPVLSLEVIGEDEYDIDKAKSYCELMSEEKIRDSETGGLGLVSLVSYSCDTSNLERDFLVAYDVDTKSFRQLPLCPPGVSQCCGIVSLNNILYACGGSLKGRHKYDPSIDRWIEIQPMSTNRLCSALVVLENRLVALGGANQRRVCLDTVEIYDPESDTWSDGVPMPKTLMGHAAATHHGCIFVSGGRSYLDDVQISKQMFCYDPEKKSWTEKAILIRGVAGHQLVDHDNRLYQFYRLSRGDQSCFCHSVGDPVVEYYEISTNTWTKLDIFSHDHTGRPIGTSVDNLLYIWLSRWYSTGSSQSLQIATFDPDNKKLDKLSEQKYYNQVYSFCSLVPLKFPSYVMKLLPKQDLDKYIWR